MKKFILIVAILTITFIIFVITENQKYNRVLKVISPVEIYVDINNNLIFDEKDSIKVKNLYFIDKDSNLDNHDILKDLSETEKFFIEYKEKQIVSRLLKNKFVKIKYNDIFVDGKSYRQILLNTGLFFDDTEESQYRLKDKIKSIDLDDYVIYNTGSRKFHKLSCKYGRESSAYKIVKKDKLNKNASPCKICILNIDNTNKISDSNIEIKKNIKYIKDYFEKGNIKIFFLDLNKIFIPVNSCETLACRILKNEIDNANKTIDFAIYGINNQDEIYNSLLKAQERGVKIRWVTDFDNRNQNYYEDSLKLQKKIVNYKTDADYVNSNKYAIMHNKFFIFDNKKVWTGSSNITSTDLTGFNANYSVLIESQQLAKIYTDEFNQMYNGNFHKLKKVINNKSLVLLDSTKIKVLFSPQDDIINSSLIPIIENAKEYIYIPIFYITNYSLIGALEKAHKKGVDIKIINDATNSHNKYSIHKELRKKGIKVKTENYAGKMHMKAAIIDDKISFIGSMNFTKTANIQNDENVLIIYDTDITKYLKETFLYIWNKIPEKYLIYDPKAESTESLGSCYDGIDNDFDNKIDMEDEGCFVK